MRRSEEKELWRKRMKKMRSGGRGVERRRDEELVPPSLELEVRFVRHFFAAKILLVIGL